MGSRPRTVDGIRWVHVVTVWPPGTFWTVSLIDWKVQFRSPPRPNAYAKYAKAPVAVGTPPFCRFAYELQALQSSILQRFVLPPSVRDHSRMPFGFIPKSAFGFAGIRRSQSLLPPTPKSGLPTAIYVAFRFCKNTSANRSLRRRKADLQDTAIQIARFVQMWRPRIYSAGCRATIIPHCLTRLWRGSEDHSKCSEMSS